MLLFFLCDSIIVKCARVKFKKMEPSEERFKVVKRENGGVERDGGRWSCAEAAYWVMAVGLTGCKYPQEICVWDGVCGTLKCDGLL